LKIKLPYKNFSNKLKFMGGVVILDGHLKSALAAVRSLGKQGVDVVCGAERESACALHSKYTKGQFVYTSPKVSPQQFITDVCAQAKTHFEKSGEKPVIFSFSDATFLALVNSAENVSSYMTLLLPPALSIACAQNKRSTYALAQKLTLPTIRTYTEAEFELVTFPAVVKYSQSIYWKNGRGIVGGTQFVFSYEELIKGYERIAQETGEAPLVMEFIGGDEYGIEMVCDSGEPLAVFAHKRIRSLSPRGGAAVVKETAQATPAVALMEQYARVLAKELLWHGPIMVEFKIDERTENVLLMEINGRFWGSLPLAVQAGVDFPLVAYNLAMGVPQKRQASAAHTARTRHFLGDCTWLYQVFFAHDPLRQRLYPSRLKALFDFKTELFKSKGDVFLWSDPIPSLFEYIDILVKWRLKV